MSGGLKKESITVKPKSADDYIGRPNKTRQIEGIIEPFERANLQKRKKTNSNKVSVAYRLLNRVTYTYTTL